MIIYINPTTVAINDAVDLAQAVVLANVNYIYLNGNILLTTGISIDPTKQSLTIDGFYPLDGTGTTHTFTDMNSVFATDTIGIRAASSISLTFKNMNIVGRNYFGVPYIQENANTSGVTVSYENIHYTGPQLAYNTYGTTRFIDCDITVEYPAATDRAEEVGEVCKVEMGGTCVIRHNDTDDAVFWFRGTRGQQSFTVLENANITINTQSYFMFSAFWNVVFFDALPTAVSIRRGGSLVLNTSYGFSLNSTHQVSTFLVDENASFVYTQAIANTTGTYHVLYLNNSLTINSGATFYMQADFATNSALIRFNAAGGVLSINNPKSAVFYCRGADFSFSQATTFSIIGGQLNYWLNRTAFPTAGTFTDIPQSKWHKDEYAIPLSISGTANTSATTVSTNNFTEAELSELPPLTNLHLYDARVLSVGDVLLDVNPIVDDQTPISGTSDPNANIRVVYTAGATQTIYSTAQQSGSYSVATPAAIPVPTPVTVSANIPFLIIDRRVNTEEAGELILVAAPALIRFMLDPISQNPLLLPREFPLEPVEVFDSRVYSTPWILTAELISQLATPSGYTLPNAVVFVNESTVLTPLSSTPLPVFTGEANDGTPKTTVITWQSNRGILAHITTPLHANERYSAIMHWEVTPI